MLVFDVHVRTYVREFFLFSFWCYVGFVALCFCDVAIYVVFVCIVGCMGFVILQLCLRILLCVFFFF